MPYDATIQKAILKAMQPNRTHTVAELAKKTGICNRYIVTSSGKLIQRGLIERVSRGCFRLTFSGLQAKREGVIIRGQITPKKTTPPRRNTLRFRLWNALRNEEKARTIDQLLEMASTGTETSPQMNAQKYLFLKRNMPGFPWRRFFVWQSRRWIMWSRPKIMVNTVSPSIPVKAGRLKRRYASFTGFKKTWPNTNRKKICKSRCHRHLDGKGGRDGAYSKTVRPDSRCQT